MFDSTIDSLALLPLSYLRFNPVQLRYVALLYIQQGHLVNR